MFVGLFVCHWDWLSADWWRTNTRSNSMSTRATDCTQQSIRSYVERVLANCVHRWIHVDNRRSKLVSFWFVSIVWSSFVSQRDNRMSPITSRPDNAIDIHLYVCVCVCVCVYFNRYVPFCSSVSETYVDKPCSTIDCSNIGMLPVWSNPMRKTNTQRRSMTDFVHFKTDDLRIFWLYWSNIV
jgi:hypothetical protein